jgi:hypothetical protein
VLLAVLLGRLPLRVRWLLLRMLLSGNVSLASTRQSYQIRSSRAEDEISKEIPTNNYIRSV